MFGPTLKKTGICTFPELSIRILSVPAVEKPNTSEPGINIPVFVSSEPENDGAPALDTADLILAPFAPDPSKTFVVCIHGFTAPNVILPVKVVSLPLTVIGALPKVSESVTELATFP